MIRRSSALSIVMTALMLQGCILVPFVSAFKSTGLASSDRMGMLEPEIKNFADALNRGNRSDALAVVAPEARGAISKQLKDLGEKERVVEAKVEEVEWKNDFYEAAVSVKVRYFLVPYYVVKTRTEKQDWEFAVGSGWRLKDREIEDAVS